MGKKATTTSSTDAPALTPEQKKQAAAEKRRATLARKTAVQRMDENDGKRMTVQLVDADEPIVGKVTQTSEKDGERRWKVGARVVTFSRIATAQLVEDQAPAPATDEQPAEKPAAEPKPEPVGITSDVRETVTQYVNEMGTSSPDAPVTALPFLLKDRVYVRVQDENGLLAWATARQEQAPSLRRVIAQLLELGFTRAPYSYTDPVKGATSASYYNAPRTVLGELTVEPRQARERAAAGARSVASVREVIKATSIPVRPEGTPEQQAECRRLEDAYNAKRQEVKDAHAAKDKARADELTAQMREAHDAWLSYRRSMVTADEPVAA
jgi:hypothetical protein